jgi:uroporphyrinogen III methyltransferase/synthase
VFVGAGPGDPGLLTRRGADLLARADVVVADELAAHGEVLGLAPAHAVLLESGHGEHGEHNEQLTRALRARHLVSVATDLAPGALLVRLVDGDPSFFGGFAEEAGALADHGIGFSVVPGVSAVSAVPAHAGIPLVSALEPGTARGVYVVSVGGAPLPDLTPALTPGVTTVVLGVPQRLRQAMAGLLDAGLDPATPLALTQDGTTGDQVTRVVTLGEAESVFTGAKPPAFPTLAVLGHAVALRENLSWFETRPLHGWRVLVPQTRDQAGVLVRRLQEYGASTQIVQTISVEPPRSPHAMDRAVTGLVTGRYEWVGFTSVNAVRAVRERLTGVGLDARAFAGLKVAAVGADAVAALRGWGIEPDLLALGEQSAAGLLAEWPDFDPMLDPINRVLLPRADIATDTLSEGLVEIGWEVDDVTAYRTVRAAPPPAPVREAIKSGAFDAVLFTSSSTVRNLLGIAGKPPATTVVACIGPQTARTAEEHGLRVDLIAPEPTIESVVDVLAAYGMERADATNPGAELVRPSQARASRRRTR